MLEQVLDYIHNYFEKDIIRGSFTIVNGSLVVDFLKEGQYYKIRGSVFNDGIYQYPSSGLMDEDFDGEVWPLAIPPMVLEVVQEIEAWKEKYGDMAGSPYSSESFGGYSYSKASGSGAGSSFTWQNAFRDRLNRWRKIS